MKLWLLMPVKPFAEGKSRLATVLSVAERAALNRRLFHHVLHQALVAQILAGVLVISRDPVVLAQAQAVGAETIVEEASELNQALVQARRQALALGAEATLVLPSDLPLLQAADIQQLYTLAHKTPSVVIAPSRTGGTSALLLHPPAVIPFAFGLSSFQRHQALAQAAGVACHVYDSATLAFDVDQPEDLARLNDGLFDDFDQLTSEFDVNLI